MSRLFHSPHLSSLFSFGENSTVCNAELPIVMGVQGVFPMARGGNYNVTARSESIQNIVLNKCPLPSVKGGKQ